MQSYSSCIWSHFQSLSFECNSPQAHHQLWKARPWIGQSDASLVGSLKSRDRMAHGELTLRKWLTNSRPLMEKIKEMESPREFSIQTEKGNQLDEDDETYHRIMVGDLEARDVNTEQKVPGTNWNYFTDQLLFKFQTHVESAQGLIPTKWNVLRVIASFYDPMSLISPIIVQMKIHLLDICKADYHWDAELELKTRWMKLISELGQVNAIQIPRCVTSEPDTKKLVYELEAFSEASSSAYAAFIYLVIKSRTSTQVRLIALKNMCRLLKEADHSEVGALSCVNTGKVDCTDQDSTGTMPRCWPCPLLDRLEECSILS